MKKKILIAVGLVLAIALIALVVLNTAYHKITVIAGKYDVAHCPRYARAGQEVTVETAVISDGELYVNGVDGEFVSPGVYVFTMPDEDVQLKVTVIANPNGV